MATRLPSFHRPPISFAHRGARAQAPENTIEAFELALRLGASGLESDVWLTADGRAVLDHDGQVGGRLRKRVIGDLDAADLPDHIPTLDDLYAQCGTGFDLSLDLKDPRAFDEVLAAARRTGPEAEARLWLCHPDREFLADCREATADARLVNSTRLAVIKRSGSPERWAAWLATNGIDVVNLHRSDWTGGLGAMFHRFELLILAWDAQHTRIIKDLYDMGMDGVFSDHVERLLEAQSELGINPRDTDSEQPDA